MLPLLLLLLTAGPEALAHDDDAPERLVPDYDYQAGVRYDEYPVVVPKRTALLLDRLMVDLKHMMDKDRSPPPPEIADNSIGRMELQRRGQQKGRNYWRCYFNAVTCFRRK